jgi:hypothetical protein
VGEALLRLLYRKGVVTPAELHKSVEALDTANVSLRAADLVVRASFKERLAKDSERAFVLLALHRYSSINCKETMSCLSQKTLYTRLHTSCL